MSLNHNSKKSLENLTPEELTNYSELVDATILSLKQELNSGSKTKARQAEMRLPLWEDKRFELDRFLDK
ncbi:hypothetical protein [Photobacterium chitinilyticum]|uniref:Uncharacterized protein n=1 Tax=Photobacterium chitinilyticum TaxID=2485123 RepID=A0A3S3RE43_9GAMM|nr:hypothetical protein [Photobacterium chitinilyticum]RWX52858.1 hypothetical protein EDI28_25040 [Photobacterium chitinilyticum]